LTATGPVRAAVVQAASVAYDPDATVAKAARLAEAAARDGAKLILFPEAFVSAYPRGLGFGAVVGSRSDEGRDMFLRYWRSAIDVPGPHVERLAEVAGDLRAFLVMGVIERDGGTLYCTVLFFEPGGTLLAKHRKVMPTGSERLIWGFGDGSTLVVHDTAIGRIAAAVCWENYMPLLRARLYRQNVQLWLAPTADARDVWIASMRHIAVEGRCFVLSCNQYARRSDYPDDYDAEFGDEADPVVTRGGSCIVDPFGNLVAGPNYSEEATLVADLDLGDTIRGKFDLDVAGHYSRSDILGLGDP
jgi:nitrilase